MLTLTDFLQIFQIAVFAVTLSDILIQPNAIFDFYGDWLDKLKATHPKLAYPLGYCPKCSSGQIALWGFGAFNSVNPFSCPLRWISYVSLTILLSAFLSAAYSKLIR